MRNLDTKPLEDRIAFLKHEMANGSTMPNIPLRIRVLEVGIKSLKNQQASQTDDFAALEDIKSALF